MKRFWTTLTLVAALPIGLAIADCCMTPIPQWPSNPAYLVCYGTNQNLKTDYAVSSWYVCTDSSSYSDGCRHATQHQQRRDYTYSGQYCTNAVIADTGWYSIPDVPNDSAYVCH
ncbi:MAG: hypothetical protein HYR64_01610 [Fimbriimonas ginsengisoli]|uniref:Secreted protein n=1 Tax=Fimbriimonas ginsengisoli TaxID=1005039 RepID=A0A931PSU0_FIMGI|nr:hypothetical protein [Fimbriimonas ginsengisoli]